MAPGVVFLVQVRHICYYGGFNGGVVPILVYQVSLFDASVWVQ